MNKHLINKCRPPMQNGTIAIKSLGRFMLCLASLLVNTAPATAQYAFNRTNWRVAMQMGSDRSKISSPIADNSHQIGHFMVRWHNANGAASLIISHDNDEGHALFSSLPGRAFILAGSARELVVQNEGSAVIRDIPDHMGCFVQSIDNFRAITTENRLIIVGRLSGTDCDIGYQMTLAPISAQRLSFDVQLVEDRPNATKEKRVNRLFLRMASPRDERVYGFGEQFSALNMKGRAVPVFVQEQGNLRGMEPYSKVINLRSKGTSGEWYSTYAPMPYFIGNYHRGMFLENSQYALFDFLRRSEVEVRVWSDRMRGQLIHGNTLLDQIEAFTEYSGRMQPLPDWIHQGAVIGMMGGSAQVREKYKTLKQAGAKIAALWLQDWVGRRQTPLCTRLWWNWEIDDASYPDWTTLTEEMKGQGVSMMGYINPYLADPSSKPQIKHNYFQEAWDNGYLVRDSAGRNALIGQGGFKAAMVDFTNPSARRWLKEIIRTQMLGNGMRGWMADFGEALPYRSRLYSGIDSAAYHNQYTQQWAELNREVLKETGAEGDAVFFNRSGFTRSPGVSPLFWSGDQLVSWDSYDGLQTAIIGLMTSGLSGISLNHWDIGGYAGISLSASKNLPSFKIVRSKELLLRWLEITPFTALFRSHEGNSPTEHYQITSSPEAIHAFAFSSQVFAALFEYRQSLMQEASHRGYPLVRHPMLHYPDDLILPRIRNQFMLGDVFMIAPVISPGAATRKLYLPTGSWVHLWSGKSFDIKPEGGWIVIKAPIGQPPVFFRSDAAEGWKLYQDVQNIAEDNAQ